MDITRFYFNSKPILESLNSIDLLFFNEHMKQERVSKGVELFKEGNQSKSVYIIKQGKVKIYQTMHGSENHILYIYRAGEMFGYRPMLSAGVNFASAMTIEECELYVLEKKHFLSAVNKSTELLKLLLINSTHEFSVIVNYIGAFSLKSGRERVALCLLILEEMYKHKGISPVEITLSRSDLAAFSGITFETLSRVITQFKDENLIKIAGRKTYITNRSALNLLAKG
jgi:CRP/FNR family transcriptional regulator